MESFYILIGSLIIGMSIGYIISRVTCNKESKKGRNYNEFNKRYDK